jgi:hypothetical protein
MGLFQFTAIDSDEETLGAARDQTSARVSAVSRPS